MTNAMPSLQMMIKLSYGWGPFPLPALQEGKAVRRTVFPSFGDGIHKKYIDTVSECCYSIF